MNKNEMLRLVTELDSSMRQVMTEIRVSRELNRPINFTVLEHIEQCYSASSDDIRDAIEKET